MMRGKEQHVFKNHRLFSLFFGPEKWKKDAGQLALVVLVGLLGATAQASGASQGQDSLIIT